MSRYKIYNHVCENCGREFFSHSKVSKYCIKPHDEVCPVCGKIFIVKCSTRTKKACSPQCSQRLGNKSRVKTLRLRYGVDNANQIPAAKHNKNASSNDIRRICVICGDTFIPRSSRRKICYKEHFHPCPVCNKPVKSDMHHLTNCCCVEHSRLQAKKIIIEKHGGFNFCNTDSAKAKRAVTCIEKYGVTNPYQATKVKDKIRATNLSRYGVENPSQSINIRSKVEATNILRYGGKAPICDNAVKQKMRDTIKDKYGIEANSTWSIPQVRDKTIATVRDKYGVENPAQSRDIHIKMSNTRKQCVASDGTKLEGSYELAVYEHCISNNISVDRQIPISYEYNNLSKRTFIDFKVDGVLVECKGGHLFQGCFDYAQVPIDVKLNVYRDNDVLIVTDAICMTHLRYF